MGIVSVYEKYQFWGKIGFNLLILLDMLSLINSVSILQNVVEFNNHWHIRSCAIYTALIHICSDNIW